MTTKLSIPGGSYVNADALSNSDTPTTKEYDALWVGVEGDVTLNMVNGGTRKFKGVSGYLFHRNKGVATGTTATDILGLF